MAQFLNAGLSLLGAGGGLLGAHHKNAVAAEQTSIAAADAQFQSRLFDIKNAFNSGMISGADAKTAIDSAVDDYGAQTSAIRTGGSEFFTMTPGFQGVKGKCNAACVTWSDAHYYGEKLKEQIDATSVPQADNKTQFAQSSVRESSTLFTPAGAAPGVSYSPLSWKPVGPLASPGAAGNVPYAQADLIPGIRLSDPRVLIGIGIAVVVGAILWFQSGGK